MLEDLKREFYDYEIAEVAIGMFNVLKDLFSFVVVAKIGNKYFVMKRKNDGYDLTVADDTNEMIDVIKDYFTATG